MVMKVASSVRGLNEEIAPLIPPMATAVWEAEAVEDDSTP